MSTCIAGGPRPEPGRAPSESFASSPSSPSTSPSAHGACVGGIAGSLEIRELIAERYRLDIRVPGNRGLSSYRESVQVEVELKCGDSSRDTIVQSRLREAREGRGATRSDPSTCYPLLAVPYVGKTESSNLQCGVPAAALEKPYRTTLTDILTSTCTSAAHWNSRTPPSSAVLDSGGEHT